MAQNCVEAYQQPPVCITGYEDIHSHINKLLMCVRFSSVVDITELEGLQSVMTAI